MVNWELNSCCNNGQATFLVTIGVFTVVILVIIFFSAMLFVVVRKQYKHGKNNGVILLWRTVLLLPFKLITVFLHEASHAIACKLTCGHKGSRLMQMKVELAGSELIFIFTAGPFSFAVKRKSNGQTLLNSSSGGSDSFGEMVFKDQYLEISTQLPKDSSLYGLGENTQPHGIKLYPNDPYTLYTTDVSAINLNTDLYGSHPVYMDLRNVGGEPFAHAVLLLNSNGMDLFYKGNSLMYKIIGGVFDFYFFFWPYSP
ncbi:hypothetical protein GOBAR_DD01494 [Gossypium barbadense]|nr:hypothetical protein GOBAR_DD01494 [Gossypium barbadense]